MDITTYRGYERWVSDAFDLDDDLSIGGDFFSRAEVAKLRDHLNTLLGDAPAAKAETVAVEVGREYRLLPGATFRAHDGAAHPAGVISTGATRVRVDHGPDREGDYKVTALNGDDAGNPGWNVDPKYLAPLDDPTPSPDVAQAARTIAGKAEQAHHYMSARWFREFANILEGKTT